MISKDSMLPDVIRQHPGTRAVFDKYGLRGCGGADGPSETVEFFARVHGVGLSDLLAEVEKAADGPAAPYVEEPGDVLYRRFFRAGIAVILTAGATLGAVILFLYGIRGTFTSLDLFGPVQGHANAQIFGWVGLFVMGFAYQGFPRFKYVRLWRPGLANLSFLLMIAGLLLRTFASLPLPGLIPVGAAGAALEAAAIALFVVVIGRTLAGATSRDPWQKFVYASLGCFLLAGLIEPLLYLHIFTAPSTEALIRRVADYMGPYRDLQIFGFAGLMILGVGQRILPAAFGLRAPGRVSGAAFWLLVAGLAVDIGAWILFRRTRAHAWAAVSWGGVVLYAVGALSLTVALRALGEGARDRSSKFVRAAFFWLVVACLMAIAEPLYDRALGVRFSHAYHGAIRHAFTVGFISLMIVGVGSKVVPLLRGIRPEGLPSLWAPFLLINVGNTLRVASQVATDLTPAAFPVMGFSGVFEVLGLAVWGLHLWRLLGRNPETAATIPARPSRIEAEMTPAQVVDWFPATLEVFASFGFTELRNPILRHTLGRRVSIRTACSMRKVDLDAFLAALNRNSLQEIKG